MQHTMVDDIRAILEMTPARWQTLTVRVSLDLLNRAPASGEWSAVDCLRHLLDTERWVFPRRVTYLLAEQDFPAFNPEREGSQPDTAHNPAELAAEFAQLRRESLILFDQVTEADMRKSARHQELGLVTLSELLHEWAAHDLNHTIQAERAIMQPFIAGCGAWQPYFADHLAQRQR